MVWTGEDVRLEKPHEQLHNDCMGRRIRMIGEATRKLNSDCMDVIVVYDSHIIQYFM